MNRTTLEEMEIKEEAEYVNTPECTVAKMAAPPAQRFLFFTFLPIAACWLVLIAIVGLRIHFAAVALEKDGNLTVENQNLKAHNKELKSRNQELEIQRNNLTGQIQDMEKNWNNLNVSRAQWSINAFCKGNKVKQCRPCQEGWRLSMGSCYEIDFPKFYDPRTWEEARGDCRGKNSDLPVVHDPREKNELLYLNLYNRFFNEYWIGLRVVEGRWKWIDGSDLAVSSWIQEPTDGHCAISVGTEEWKSVSCEDKKQWICTKDALSV